MPAPIAIKSAASAGLCAAVGFVSAHAAVSYGYGLAIAWHARAALGRDDAGRRPRPARLRPQGDGLPGPARPREALPRRGPAAVPGPREGHEVPVHADDAQDPARRRRRFAMLYAAPIRLLANAPRPRVTVFAGAVAAAALAGPDRRRRAEVRGGAARAGPALHDGPLRASRHVNYASDIVLHGAVAVAAALSAPSVTALLAVAAPLAVCSIVLSATASLDGRQRAAYRDDAFGAYVAKTPRLFFT